LLSDQCVHTIKAAVFDGTTKIVFKDRREFNGSLLKQLNKVYEYISQYNRIRAEYTGLHRVCGGPDERALEPPVSAPSPAALRLIKQVVDVSHRAGKWTGICGELAGEPEVAAILLGLGVDELSMSASSILAVKKIICNTPYQKAREIAAAALGLKTAKEVQEYAVEQG
jgi:hypothetical protein